MTEPNGQPPVILLVDHDELASRLLTLRFDAAGLRHTWVKTGREALSRIGQIGPQLVILELDAPGVDGFEMLARLRAAPSAQGVPIMILAAKPNIDDMQRALQLGASDYLTKPVDAAAVVERIDRRLGRLARMTPRE